MDGFMISHINNTGISVTMYNRFGTVATAVFAGPSRKKQEYTLFQAITKMGRTITKMG
jgi:hypothetical protein